MLKHLTVSDSNGSFDLFALLQGAGYDKNVCLGPHKKGDSSKACEETS